MLQRHGLIQLTSLKATFSYQLIGLQWCDNYGVAQPTTTMEMVFIASECFCRRRMAYERGIHTSRPSAVG